MSPSILRTLELPTGRVVLTDWSGSNPYRLENLACYLIDGSLKWKAKLPEHTGSDWFTSLELDQNGNIRAFTWSCYLLSLDPESGQTLETVFHK
jgi:outer membrane protein assembly factor BamB